MDIRDWPIDKIMQLPADAFGQRIVYLFSDQVVGAATKFLLSRLSLPDRAVLWGIDFAAYGSTNPGLTGIMGYTLSFAQRDITGVAEFISLPELVPGSQEIVSFVPTVRGPLAFRDLKMFIEPQGAKLALRAINVGAETARFTVSVVISSIPNEIPDFYGNPRSDQLDEMIRLMRIGANMPVENSDVAASSGGIT